MFDFPQLLGLQICQNIKQRAPNKRQLIKWADQSE